MRAQRRQRKVTSKYRRIWPTARNGLLLEARGAIDEYSVLVFQEPRDMAGVALLTHAMTEPSASANNPTGWSLPLRRLLYVVANPCFDRVLQLVPDGLGLGEPNHAMS